MSIDITRKASLCRHDFCYTIFGLEIGMTIKNGCAQPVAWCELSCSACGLTWIVVLSLWLDVTCCAQPVAWCELSCSACGLTWFVMLSLSLDVICRAVPVAWRELSCSVCRLTWTACRLTWIVVVSLSPDVNYCDWRQSWNDWASDWRSINQYRHVTAHLYLSKDDKPVTLSIAWAKIVPSMSLIGVLK